MEEVVVSKHYTLCNHQSIAVKLRNLSVCTLLSGYPRKHPTDGAPELRLMMMRGWPLFAALLSTAVCCSAGLGPCDGCAVSWRPQGRKPSTNANVVIHVFRPHKKT